MYTIGMAGRKRPARQPNYHQLTNNAVFPTEDQDVVHYHSKVVRDQKPKLAPTLRSNNQDQSSQERDIGRESIDSSVYDKRAASPQSRFLSEYQSRTLGMEKPDYQVKRATGKKAIAPPYQRQKDEQLYGVGMLVVSRNQLPQQGVFNQATLKHYNGRKRQYVDFNYQRESTKMLTGEPPSQD